MTALPLPLIASFFKLSHTTFHRISQFIWRLPSSMVNNEPVPKEPMQPTSHDISSRSPDELVRLVSRADPFSPSWYFSLAFIFSLLKRGFDAFATAPWRLLLTVLFKSFFAALKIVFVANCCCFPWSARSSALTWHTVGFFLLQCDPGQWLCNGYDLSFAFSLSFTILFSFLFFLVRLIFLKHNCLCCSKLSLRQLWTRSYGHKSVWIMTLSV